MDQTLIGAACAFLAIAGIGWALTADNQGAPSLKRFKDGEKVSRLARKVSLDPISARKKSVAESLKEIERKQKARRASILSVKGQIAQAGLKTSVETFWSASALLAVVCGGVAFVFGLSPLLALGVAFAMGLGAPRWVLGFLCSMRQKKFTSQFADGIDVIVRGVRSGLPLNECLRIIARESPQPLAQEFQQVVDGFQVGINLDQSLAKLYERMPLPEVNFFNIVLNIQQKTGGNLSEALNNLSVVLRSRKMLAEKIKALSSEARASAMIIGSLPLVVMMMVYFTTPDYILVLFTHPIGHMLLLTGGMLMSLGIFVMNKMVNFKY